MTSTAQTDERVAMDGGKRRPSKALLLLAVAMAATGGTIVWARTFVDLRHTELFMQDWFVYYAAGAAARAGKVALLFDGRAFTAFQYMLLRPWFVVPPSLHPWLYPPPFLLLLAPLSVLSFPVSYAVFQLASGAAALTALAWRQARRDFAWWSALLLLFFPATADEALAGQNALLTGALIIGGMRALATSPALAGTLLGAVTYKPQLFVMVPVALIARREWRALAFACISATLLCLISTLVFGPQSWWLWFEQVVHGGDPAQAQWYGQTFLTGYSFYVCAILGGLGPLGAKLVQGVAALAAAGAVWWSHRRTCTDDVRLGILLVATVMATPHLQAYDMLLLGAAAILFFVRSRDGIDGFELALFAGTWMLPLLRPSVTHAGIYVIPVVLTGLLVEGVRRTNAQPRPSGKPD